MVKHPMFPFPCYHRRYGRGEVGFVFRPICLAVEDDKLVGILSLKLVDELDEVVVTVLAMVLAILLVALHHYFLQKYTLQRDMLCAGAVGAIAGDVQRQGVIDVQRPAAKALIDAQLQHHVGEEHRFLRCQGYHQELCLHHGLCGQSLQGHLEADWDVDQHYDV